MNKTYTQTIGTGPDSDTIQVDNSGHKVLPIATSAALALVLAGCITPSTPKFTVSGAKSIGQAETSEGTLRATGGSDIITIIGMRGEDVIMNDTHPAAATK
ncbi:hypothetical protein [Yoonia sp. MH D7]